MVVICPWYLWFTNDDGFIKNRPWWYHQFSNISRNLVGNKPVDHWDVVGALPVGAAKLHLHYRISSNGIGKDKCNTRRKTFIFVNFVRHILEVFKKTLYIFVKGEFDAMMESWLWIFINISLTEENGHHSVDVAFKSFFFTKDYTFWFKMFLNRRSCNGLVLIRRQSIWHTVDWHICLNGLTVIYSDVVNCKHLRFFVSQITSVDDGRLSKKWYPL